MSGALLAATALDSAESFQCLFMGVWEGVQVFLGGLDLVVP